MIELSSKKQKIFFTSDLHFNHAAIMKFCNRPFASVEEMNEKLIENWNNVVGEKDIVFDLGDVCFKNKWDCLDQLNGKHYLIYGNHDESLLRYPEFKSKFQTVQAQQKLLIDGRCVYLNHYPFLCYAGTYRKESDAVYALSGHVHVTKFDNTGKDFERLQYLFPYQYDVGVDFNDYRPISWEEVKNKITTQVKLNKNLLYWVNS